MSVQQFSMTACAAKVACIEYMSQACFSHIIHQRGDNPFLPSAQIERGFRIYVLNVDDNTVQECIRKLVSVQGADPVDGEAKG